ncbi:MAG: S9 family peptidase [Bryobacterales bacterium]|nr:S9 family peptidase [Bryobacterales bacterium]
MKRILASFLLLPLLCLAGAPVWTPELAIKLKLVGEVLPSPDGQLVAYTQAQAVVTETDSHMLTHIWLANADGSARFQLTRGDKSCTAPVWSPDGKYIYFSSDRSGKMNLWRIPVGVGEAEQLTNWKGSLGGFRPSPDGKQIAFAGRDEDKDLEKRKKEKNDAIVVDENPPNHGLWLVQVEKGDDGKRVPVELVKSAYHVLQFEWTPDSRAIVFDHQPTPIADDWTKSDVSVVTVETKELKPLAASTAAESNPKVSPDGRYVAIVRSAPLPRWMGVTHIALIPLGGGEARELARTRDQRPNLVGWASDSRSMLYQENWHTRTGIHRMPIDGPVEEVFCPAQGVLRAASLNASGTHIGYGFETSSTPRDAYVMPVGASAGTKVSDSMAGMVPYPMPNTEVIRWKSKDGSEMEGLLTYPMDYRPGQRYPMVLNIHGGPAGVFTETYAGGPSPYPIATFAGKGYAVLRPNPRGSGGYGAEFRVANVNDWGGGDYQDILAGVDKVIAMGVADADRLAVMGWSYGGFMTSWIVTQTDRFKAAAVGAGVTNLWSFTGTADIPGFLPDYFQGEPWEVFENYRSHSPITFANRVKTPTLVLHGEADVRVPLSQGQEFYRALKTAGAITRMVTYPRTPHGPQEPKFLLDIMNRHLDWVEKYVK